MRRERNKLAAAKCRNRRRELTDRLQAVSTWGHAGDGSVIAAGGVRGGTVAAHWDGGGMAMSPTAGDITGMGWCLWGQVAWDVWGQRCPQGHGDVGRGWLTWTCWKGTG